MLSCFSFLLMCITFDDVCLSLSCKKKGGRKNPADKFTIFQRTFNCFSFPVCSTLLLKAVQFALCCLLLHNQPCCESSYMCFRCCSVTTAPSADLWAIVNHVPYWSHSHFLISCGFSMELVQIVGVDTTPNEVVVSWGVKINVGNKETGITF